MSEGAGVAKEKITYAPETIEKEALKFIVQNKNNPFFLYLAHNIPHANNEAGYFTGDGMEVPSYGEYINQDWPNTKKGFASMIRLIDQTVGKVQMKIKELGLDENTIIFFTSDNGPHEESGHMAEFFNSYGHLTGKKRDLY